LIEQLNFRRVSKKLPGGTLLGQVDLDVTDGDFAVLV
jgi:hypothetical protein